LEIQKSSSSNIITLQKLREKVALATARERLAKRILRRSSTVLIMENEPESLYPVLLSERLYDTAAYLASESHLSFVSLFDALTKQYLSDQSRKDADISVIDESERKNPSMECEYASECVSGEELRYYLEHYGTADHYILVAKQILSSVSNVDVPSYITKHIQQEQPWVLVSLYNDVGRLTEAGNVAIAMLPPTTNRNQRIPLQCVDKLVINLERHAQSCRSEQDREASLKLASTLRNIVSAYISSSTD